jgi:GSCFA family
METQSNAMDSISAPERALEPEAAQANDALAKASAFEQRANHLQRIVLRLQREVDDLRAAMDSTNAQLQTIRAHDPENLDPPLPTKLVNGYRLSEDDAALLKDGYVSRDRRIAALITLCKSGEEKFAHVWHEYEYYLDQWKKLSITHGSEDARNSEAELTQNLFPEEGPPPEVKTFYEVMRVTHGNKAWRDYPRQADQRVKTNLVFPQFKPKFSVDFSHSVSVFTIGSCFARSIEETLAPLGVDLPTMAFSVPETEWPYRPNGLLNEYTPAGICQRITAALSGKPLPLETIVASGGSYADLMLPTSADVSYDRALARREDISKIYRRLPSCDVAVITLGFVEAWFDVATQQYLNRMPPYAFATANPDRFLFTVLNVENCMRFLEKTVMALGIARIKVILTVSPVPLQSTFTSDDCVTANEYSKSILRVCAQALSNAHAHVDYFPSYEIVRSAGLGAYIDDHVHVRDDVVSRVTDYMVRSYAGGTAVTAEEHGFDAH